MQDITIADRFRCILTVSWFLLSLFVSTVVLIPVMALTLGRARNFMIKYLGIFIGCTSLWVAGIRLNIRHVGTVPDRPAIYIFNHSSTVDLFILLSLGLENIRFVAKREFQFNPFFFILGNLTGQIFIPRGNSRRSVRILKKSYQRIVYNKLSVVMGPEGSRKHEGVIGPFKKGAFLMAVELGYPIVPMYFENASDLCRGQSLITTKGTVTAYIHPAIDTSAWKKEDTVQNMKNVRRMYLTWAGVAEEAA